MIKPPGYRLFIKVSLSDILTPFKLLSVNFAHPIVMAVFLSNSINSTNSVA
jgi:hypothetical protein